MMHKNLITVLLLWTSLLLAPLVFAQEEAPAPEQESEETEKSGPNTGSQETEYNDDNYRRFMELKDQQTQTSTLPTNSYQSGTDKLDELPESSQKHLRNQLREIILESDEWAPGDENGEYPFVASEAGEKNPELKQQEKEAWGELVGKYHEREAQIYANAERSEAAAGAEGGAPDAAQAQANAGESEGQQGSSSGEGGEGDEQQQSGQRGQSGQQGQSTENQTASNANEGSDSASSSSASAGDPNAVSTSGVSESALEYLLSGNSKTGSSTEPGGNPGGQDSNAAQQQQQAGTSDPGQAGSPVEQTADQQTAAQQAAAEQSAAQQAMAQQQAAAAETAQTESESLSQQQSSQQQDQQQQTTQQNASEFVVISKGTLSIKELQNAQGITISIGGNTPDGTEEDHPRKDDDG